MKPIRVIATFDTAVHLPGSKSYTNRALVAAALATGDSVIDNASFSDDTKVLAAALGKLGMLVTFDDEDRIIRVTGCGGILPVKEAEINLGNTGTAMRFLIPVVAIGSGRYVLDGDARMRERPVGELVKVLRDLGADVKYLKAEGFPPVEIRGGFSGGDAVIPGDTSSQFCSGLLLAAPYGKNDLDLSIEGDLVSRPYVDMTVEVMEHFDATVERDGYEYFHVIGGDEYNGQIFEVEPDASGAAFFLAAAAVTGGRIRVEGLGKDTLQGDVAFSDVLEAMGCAVERKSSATLLKGGDALTAVEVDMRDYPDLVPPLAIVAAFAQGKTLIRNVAHLRYKESDRLRSLATGLAAIGAHVEELEDGLAIESGELHGAEIDPFRDHRIAMAFAVAGLRIPGMVIKDPACVAKSYPGFFDELEKLDQAK
ncbi:MAG: 3-phosphoshikimate 1-carboxyvinyltransferase [Planctomycetota bacterium]